MKQLDRVSAEEKRRRFNPNEDGQMSRAERGNDTPRDRILAKMERLSLGMLKFG